MKAVIVEIRDNLASLLTDDGCIEIKKNRNYKTGQVIHMNDLRKSSIKKISAIAGFAAAFILLGTGTWAYASPYTYVSVDVNPSIEYTVNRFDRVIKVKAVNNDGEDILNKISMNMANQTIDAAITNTVNQISEAGYFDQDTQGGIVITTSCANTDKADTLADELKQMVEQETADQGNDVKVETCSVGLKRVEEARALGVTPGKLNLVEKLKAASGNSSDIDIKEWLNKPVKDIMQETKIYLKKSAGTNAIDDIEQQNTNDNAAGLAEDTHDQAKKASENSGKKVRKENHINAEDNEDADYEDNEDGNYEDNSNAQTSDVKEKAKETAERAKEQAKKAAQKAKEAAQKEARQAEEQAEKEAERTRKQLKEDNEQDEDQDYKIDNDSDENDSDYEENDSAYDDNDSDYEDKQYENIYEDNNDEQHNSKED